jgi:RNA polymerase sigma-70 factor, ECF subfamily
VRPSALPNSPWDIRNFFAEPNLDLYNSRRHFKPATSFGKRHPAAGLYWPHPDLRGSMATRQEDPSRLPSTPEAGHDLTSTLYQELHRLALGKMRFERGNHSLQPTALVNEAYLRLVECSDSMWVDRGRVLGIAAKVMRHVLVDHARARNAGKRGDGQLQVTLVDDIAGSTSNSTADVLAVDEALTRLAEFDPRQATVLEMHFFGGLSFEEIALQLDVSSRTVKRDWTMARAWLRQELSSH